MVLRAQCFSFVVASIVVCGSVYYTFSDPVSRPPADTLVQTPIRVVCLGDTHGRHDVVEVPEGDVLIHSGDVSMFGAVDHVVSFNKWLGRLPHAHKIVISGNHDPGNTRVSAKAGDLGLDGLRRAITNAHYLQDETVSVTVPGKGTLQVWGSPWQPQFKGFGTSTTEHDADLLWRKSIPTGVDVVVTHSPPRGLLDTEAQSRGGAAVGSQKLTVLLSEYQPLLSCFGHIHSPGGRAVSKSWHTGAVAELEQAPLRPAKVSRGEKKTVFVNGACAAASGVDSDGFYPIDTNPVVVDVYV